MAEEKFIPPSDAIVEEEKFTPPNDALVEVKKNGEPSVSSTGTLNSGAIPSMDNLRPNEGEGDKKKGDLDEAFSSVIAKSQAGYINPDLEDFNKPQVDRQTAKGEIPVDDLVLRTNVLRKMRAASEQKAKELFNAVEQRGLIIPGKSESELAAEIVTLAKEQFCIESFWHKKIVRAGASTLYPYSGNPQDQVIKNDDIVFLDFGPIFNGWEADLGRTYVIGNDPLKQKLKKDVEEAWQVTNAWYHRQTELTGAACFHYVTELAKNYGWEFGGDIAGHIVGRYPHEQPDDPADLGLDIHSDNHSSILLLDKHGNKRNWILEIQFVDRINNIGAFFEQLLTTD